MDYQLAIQFKNKSNSLPQREQNKNAPNEKKKKHTNVDTYIFKTTGGKLSVKFGI